MLKTNKWIKKLITLIAGLMLLVYALQVFNNTFYIHTHILSNGKVFTHAHPYNKVAGDKPVSDHKHSIDQIIAMANSELLFPVLFIAFAFVLTLSQQPAKDLLIPDTRPACVILHKGRAPPIL